MSKVSVIVPVYNVEKYLPRCLNSLISQTLSDIEIICINDGSTDGSGKILEEYGKKDNRIKVITQENKGISTTRNTGLDIAKGEFIGYVDSDDFIDKDFYEKLYNAAKSSNTDIACACVVRENEKTRKILVEYKEEKVAKGVKEKFEMACIPEHCYIWNKIYSREKLERNGIRFKDGLLYEDIIYTPEAVESLGEMVVVPNLWYHYQKRSDSTIKIDSDKIRADKLYAKKYLIKICQKYGVKLDKKGSVVYKKDYKFLGLKILKEYGYSATRKFYLFGIVPVFEIKEYV